MENIIKLIRNHYLIGNQEIKLLNNGKIEFTADDGEVTILNKKDFINEYIDFLTDLLNDNRECNFYQSCINILNDLKILYDGLIIVNLINND